MRKEIEKESESEETWKKYPDFEEYDALSFDDTYR